MLKVNKLIPIWYLGTKFLLNSFKAARAFNNLQHLSIAIEAILDLTYDYIFCATHSTQVIGEKIVRTRLKSIKLSTDKYKGFMLHTIALGEFGCMLCLKVS
jgi:hypothetical protein